MLKTFENVKKLDGKFNERIINIMSSCNNKFVLRFGQCVLSDLFLTKFKGICDTRICNNCRFNSSYE